MDLFKKKINFVLFLMVLLFAAVLIRAFYLQIWNRKKLISYSDSQFIRTIKKYPHRGQIYDRNGAPLVINVDSYSVFTMPHLLKERGVFKKLARIIPEINYQSLLKKVKGRSRFTWLGRKLILKDEQVAAVKKLEGIYLEKEPKRIYPNHELLSQVLGFVGTDNKGLSGIEYSFDDQLRGNAQIVKYLKDAKGRPLKFETVSKSQDSEELHLSIDKQLQAVSEQYLKKAVLEHKASLGGFGVMDAETGEILAMGNYPHFDPNSPFDSPAKDRKLSFISDPFEPGSVFKIFTVASAISNNVVQPETNYFCELGRLIVQNHEINESDSHKKYEWLSVSEIIAKSSNVGTTKIAFDLGFPKLKTTLEKFSIGLKTGVELPGESRGIFKFQESIDLLSLSNLSFGQGVATTGLQILAAYSSIANGGNWIQPTILKREEVPPKTRIMEKETAKKLEQMLIEAVEHGTGRSARIPYFTVAGKTSTAQKANKGEGYNSYIPGFIAYTTNTEKRYVVFVYIEDPNNKKHFGSEVAAPVVKHITQYMLYRNKKFNAIAVDDEDIHPQAIDAVKIKQSKQRELGRNKVPSFLGLDKLSANKLAGKYKFTALHRGVGLVTRQSPPMGSPVTNINQVVLYYEPPNIEQY